MVRGGYNWWERSPTSQVSAICQEDQLTAEFWGNEQDHISFPWAHVTCRNWVFCHLPDLRNRFPPSAVVMLRMPTQTLELTDLCHAFIHLYR